MGPSCDGESPYMHEMLAVGSISLVKSRVCLDWVGRGGASRRQAMGEGDGRGCSEGAKLTWSNLWGWPLTSNALRGHRDKAEKPNLVLDRLSLSVPKCLTWSSFSYSSSVTGDSSPYPRRSPPPTPNGCSDMCLAKRGECLIVAPFCSTLQHVVLLRGARCRPCNRPFADMQDDGATMTNPLLCAQK